MLIRIIIENQKCQCNNIQVFKYSSDDKASNASSIAVDIVRNSKAFDA